MSSTEADKRAERMKKLRDLHLKRNEARQLNHQEVVEEDKRIKLPENYEAKRRRADWEIEDSERREQAKTSGMDYDRVRMLEVGADEADRLLRKKKRTQNPDQGFSDYEQATQRKYDSLVKQITPNMSDYEKEKQKVGEESFYPTANTIILGKHKDSNEGIDRMVQDLEKQLEKRGKYSRRRTHNDDLDIDYINERNMRFNKKLERFYGSYTTEIKQNLERGTAV